MLTRVEINGFKSFQDFSVDLEPLFMVLGPNSAGKSNLFDALAVVSRLAQMEVSSALQGGRGSIRDQFSHTSDGIAETMSFGIELLLADTDSSSSLAQTRFRYELALGRKELASGIEELSVLQESLRPIAGPEDKWIASHPELARFARYGASEVFLKHGHILQFSVSHIENDIDITPEQLRAIQASHADVTRDRGSTQGELGGTMNRSIPAFTDKTVLAELGSAFSPHISAVTRELRSWRFLHLGMAALRESSERAASTRLASDGSNLPTALAALPKEVGARVQADRIWYVERTAFAEHAFVASTRSCRVKIPPPWSP